MLVSTSFDNTIVVSVVFSQFSDTSSFYHWIKGRSFISLFQFYMIMEMSDIIGRSIGKELIYCLARNIYNNESSFKVAVLVWIYTLLHSYLLFFQMWTLNSVFQSKTDTILLYLLTNNFTEIKIYVFKSTDKKKLYELGIRDICERFQHYIFLIYILACNQVDLRLLGFIACFVVAEFVVDNLKNFLLNMMYKHDPSVYLIYRLLVSKIFLSCLEKKEMREGPEDQILEESSDTEDMLQDLEEDELKVNYMSEANKECIRQYKDIKSQLWTHMIEDMTLFRHTMNESFNVSMFNNFTILPQIWLILRCVFCTIYEADFKVEEIIMLTLFIMTIGWIVEYTMSRITRPVIYYIEKNKHLS